jgi:diguanylate cyclase (GGDEF)-like protein
MSSDARVSELQFLAHLDGSAAPMTVTSDTCAEFALTPDRFRDLVFGLLAQDLVTGGEPRSPAFQQHPHPPTNPRNYLWAANDATHNALLAGAHPYTIRITHEGRVRLARLRQELDDGRLTDPTGILVDGRHFDTDLRVRFAMAGRDTLISVLVADLDHFKAVNDTLGHPKGDEVLRRCFGILRDIVTSQGGEAYRKGGDETLAILVHHDEQTAANTAERIRQTIESEFADLHAQLERPPTASIGIGTFVRPAPPDLVFAAVDKLLYQAKAAGKNRVVHRTFRDATLPSAVR